MTFPEPPEWLKDSRGKGRACEKGKALFVTNCSACHGPQPMAKAPPCPL
jgi:mono/diheme cytochrome c family protein